MSRWLLRKKEKRRSRSPPPADDNVKHVFNRNKSPATRKIMKSDIKLCNNNDRGIQIVGPIRDILKIPLKKELQAQTQKDDLIYSEPWDIECKMLDNGENCCGCLSNPATPLQSKRNISAFRGNGNISKMSCKFIEKDQQTHTNSKHDRPLRFTNHDRFNKGGKCLTAADSEDSDTGCEFSDESEETDNYEFLENIERRLKTDKSKVNSVALPKWDCPFYQKGRTKNLNLNPQKKEGFNANCVDEIIYNSGSDNSSGFFEAQQKETTEEKSEQRYVNCPKSEESVECSGYSRGDSELFSFPDDVPNTSLKPEIRFNHRNSSRLYQTGFISKGNRLLGDLIQLNYEKQQLF